MLCRMIDGRTFLRVRSPNGSHRDYDIAHCDLAIEVRDDDAYVYRRNGKLVIDYGPATLGTEGGAADKEENKMQNQATQKINEDAVLTNGIPCRILSS